MSKNPDTETTITGPFVGLFLVTLVVAIIAVWSSISKDALLREAAYERGRDAKALGRTGADNPYKNGSWLRSKWFDGYHAVEKSDER